MTLRKESSSPDNPQGSDNPPERAQAGRGKPETKANHPAGGQIEALPRVFVVVLHWRGSHYTRACLASIRSLHYPNYEILLVDNGSDDESGVAIARQFPGVSVLNLEQNLGFAGGCNAALAYCVKQGAEWIWLLNNDTKVAADSLELLVGQANQRADAGALGAVVRTGDGEHFVTSGPGEIDFIRAKTYLRSKFAEAKPALECQWLSGSNLLLSVNAIKEVGGFDEDYFLYFEDTDLCHRLSTSKWKCLLVPAASVEHVGGASTEGKRSYWRAYYYTRNRLLFFMKSLKGVARLPALVFVCAHLLRHALVLPFRGDRGRNQLRAEYLGLRDYMSGRLGQATCLDWCDEE